MYTHIYQLAQEIKKGVESADPNIQIELYQVPETLPQEVLDKMYAPPKPDVPIITGKAIIQVSSQCLGICNKHYYIYLYKKPINLPKRMDSCSGSQLDLVPSQLNSKHF